MCLWSAGDRIPYMIGKEAEEHHGDEPLPNLFDKFGVDRPRDKTGGPPVELETLHAFIEQALSEEESRRVALLVAEFKAWREALHTVARGMPSGEN